jgi:hypothetical protein
LEFSEITFLRHHERACMLSSPSSTAMRILRSFSAMSAILFDRKVRTVEENFFFFKVVNVNEMFVQSSVTIYRERETSRANLLAVCGFGFGFGGF